MNTALILIDLQNDYFPGGKMELEGSLLASSCAGNLLKYFRERKLPLIHIQHINVRPGATFFLPATEGVEIHEKVKPLPGELVVQKNYPNSFRNTDLLKYLERESIKQLVLSGMMTHMCVDATTRAAFDYGFQCTVVSDACATRALSFEDNIIPARHVHGAFLAALNNVYANVVSTRDFMKTVEERK